MIVPVLLEKAFDTIVTKIKSVDTKAKRIQIDILDKTITPTRTFTDYKMLDTIQTPAELEIHLMVQDPLKYLEQKVSKCTRICSQIEKNITVHAFIKRAKLLGYEVGISLDIDTPWKAAIPYIKEIDYIQFMAVKVGKQGQKLDPTILKKIKEFHRKYRKIPIQVDGGIKEANIKKLHKVGVKTFVVGSAIFGGGNPTENYIQLDSLPWTK